MGGLRKIGFDEIKKTKGLDGVFDWRGEILNLQNIAFGEALGAEPNVKNLFYCMYGKSDFFKEQWKKIFPIVF
jgi:hypothetical protein